MATILRVKDITVFSDMIKTITKIVPDAMFSVDNKGTVVRVINESQTIRAYLKSDAITSAEPIDFCFKDIINLKRSIDLIKNIEGVEECELKLTGSFISYDNDVKFKLKLVKPEIIERYVTKDITTKLEKVFSFNTTLDEYKQVLQCCGIVSDPSSKVYISEDKGKVICEIDDKNNVMANSVGIPVSDKIDGIIEKPIAVGLENFQMFGILGTDKININFTDKNVFEIRASNLSLSLYMISTVLKG